MPKPEPVKILGKTYRSVNKAAQSLGVNKSSLSKIIKASKTQMDLDNALSLVKNRKLGYHEKSVEINGTSYSSLASAGSIFGVTGRAVAHWITIQGSTCLEIDMEKHNFERLEKGSQEHLRALAHRAGFFSLRDWEKKKREASNLGTFNDWLRKKWDGDLFKFLQTEFPNEIFHWWKMARTPVGTWQDEVRLKEYMAWLAEELNFKEIQDWFKITAKDFQKNYGGSIQAYYPSILDILEVCYPDTEWLPWLFDVAPNGCWKKKSNHRRFLDFVALEEQFSRPEDWYSATQALFDKYKGASLIKEYETIFDCISSNYPEHNLRFWFMKKSRGNWRKKENQREYLEWLGEKLCFTKPADWYHVIETDFINHHGVTLISNDYHCGVANCIMSVFDEHHWEETLFQGKNHWKMQLRVFATATCAFPLWNVERELSLQSLTLDKLEGAQRVDVFINRPSDNQVLVLEYNGRQHYEHIHHFHKTIEEFEAAQGRDKIKRDVLRDGGIPLIEIKYSDWDGSIEYILELLNDHFGTNISKQDVWEQAEKRGLYEPIFAEVSVNSKLSAASSAVPLMPLDEILNYADLWFKEYKKWPKKGSGPVGEDTELTWNDVNNQCKRKEHNSSLANLLLEKRQVRHHLAKKNLSIQLIISWAKHHYQETNSWPTYESGVVLAEPSENWGAIRSNLVAGGRGLPSGLSIEKVLTNELGIVGVRSGKNLTEELVIRLAKAHFELTEVYPHEKSTWILDGSDSWAAISAALREGLRGLPGGTSLAQLLDKAGLKANSADRSYPSLMEIIKAAEEFKELNNGNLPSRESGVFPNYLDLTWGKIDAGLKRGDVIEGTDASSIADLWTKQFGYRNVNNLPDLSENQILEWCDLFKGRTGQFPSNISQSVVEMGTETFMSIDVAFRENRRGMNGHSSLSNFLFEKRGKRNNKNLPDLTLKMIVNWMIDWHNETGAWPTVSDGEIPNSGGEKWSNLNATLHRGGRNLPKTSLAKLRKKLEKFNLNYLKRKCLGVSK